MSEHELTICSVSFHSGEHLKLNWKLTNCLNPAPQVRWVVVENTRPGSNYAVDMDSHRFLVCRGDEYDPTKPRPASYHHGLALNRAIHLVETRFALVLDPDFYIVRRNWIADAIRHMKTRNLTFWGTPWHPKWYTKYRYFPCAHCLFIDLERVRRDTLDFRPGNEEPGSGRVKSQLKNLLPGVIRHVVQTLTSRRHIGRSADTGYYVHRQYSRHKTFQSSCVMPVYKLREDYPAHAWRQLSSLLDRVLPDRFSFLPKQPNYYSQVGFRERGYVDTTAYGWEEFMWQDEPFGFHVRGQQQSARDISRELTLLHQTIFSLTGVEALRADRA